MLTQVLSIAGGEVVDSRCDRVVVLAYGLVAAEGAPAELFRRARVGTLEDAFVAFTGTAEVLPC